MRTSELLILEDAPPTKSAQKPTTTTTTTTTTTISDIVTLHKHIQALRSQLIISHNDLIQLGSFLAQPLLRHSSARTAYAAARRAAAVEYATNTLESISDVVTAVGTHVSGAEIRLRLLCGRFEGGVYPITSGSLRRLEELVQQVWELHGVVRKALGRAVLRSVVSLR